MEDRRKTTTIASSCGVRMCTNKMDVLISHFTLVPRGLQPVLTLIYIPNDTLITFPLVHAGEMKVSGWQYLVMALSVSDAFLAISPVGHRVHNVSHVPIFILEFFNDLRMEENEYINNWKTSERGETIISQFFFLVLSSIVQYFVGLAGLAESRISWHPGRHFYSI